jgi:DNA-directed RNA polymerase beta' subunit
MTTRIASSPSLRDTKAHGYLLCLNLFTISKLWLCLCGNEAEKYVGL